VLASCETPYDPFPPPPFDGLPEVARKPETLAQVLGALRDPEVRRSPQAYGSLAKHPVEAFASDSYALPCLFDEGVLRDASRAMSSARSEPIHEAGRRLIAEFARPVLFAWATEDPVFPVDHARRYAAALKDARLIEIEDAYSFTPEDQPERLAQAIAGFAR
jgi:pimeloyl-ACP methyl ester carboxylesterase